MFIVLVGIVLVPVWRVRRLTLSCWCPSYWHLHWASVVPLHRASGRAGVHRATVHVVVRAAICCAAIHAGVHRVGICNATVRAAVHAAICHAALLFVLVSAVLAFVLVTVTCWRLHWHLSCWCSRWHPSCWRSRW